MGTTDNLAIYRVTDDYIQFLQGIDHRIMDNRKEDGAVRVYLGTVYDIGVHKYFAPLTSYKEETHGNMKSSSQTYLFIKGKDRDEEEEAKIALIYFNNMFPVTPSEIESIDFSKERPKYRDLLEKEYRFIVQQQERIFKKARNLYKLRTKKNPQPFFEDICVDFKKLEQEYVNFGKKIVY